MYKLFLCLRYLRSRIIAYFAVLAVALCVAMMLIVISVMNGFLDKIEQAAKGLFGDIVVEPETVTGMGRYNEFIAEVKRQVPGVEGGSPFIITYGLLRVPDTPYRQTVEVAGIRLPERAEVTEFEDGLFAQKGVGKPTFDPPIDLLIQRIREHGEEVEKIYRREIGDSLLSDLAPAKIQLFERLHRSNAFRSEAEFTLKRARPHQRDLSELQKQLDAAEAAAGGERTEQIEQLSEQLDELLDKVGIMSPVNRAILGLGIPGLSFRTEQGETVRYILPGHDVVLSMIPFGKRLSTTDIETTTVRLTVVDDSRTDVSSIDSNIVYLPFATLQRLNNMGAEYLADDGRMVVPPRCSQIHLKVKEEFSQGEKLREVSQRVKEVWVGFRKRYPDSANDVTIQTWRQRQAKVIRPIQQQRTLVVTMFGIISLVSVVLIFVIFYTIVIQKTKDIGVLKAIGASSAGVAQIFLGYGATIGLLGSIIGCIGGYYFVRYINPIQDALDKYLGFRVWSKEWFLFEKIPNEVDPLTAVVIVIGAIIAGLCGALVPAIRAARMQPVEALRYE